MMGYVYFNKGGFPQMTKHGVEVKKIIAGIAIGILLATSLPAIADYRDGGREKHWKSHEIHRFGERDLAIWQNGYWHHGRHEGRRGWWWVAAGIWYFYPAPIYPYPDPYTPPVIVIDQQPPVMAVPQATAPSQSQSQLPAQSWYYCDSAKSYYPYVPNCPEGWKSVPAQPPQEIPH